MFSLFILEPKCPYEKFYSLQLLHPFSPTSMLIHICDSPWSVLETESTLGILSRKAFHTGNKRVKIMSSSGRCWSYCNQEMGIQKSTHLNCRHEENPMEPVIQGLGHCPWCCHNYLSTAMKCWTLECWMSKPLVSLAAHQ